MGQVADHRDDRALVSAQQDAERPAEGVVRHGFVTHTQILPIADFRRRRCSAKQHVAGGECPRRERNDEPRTGGAAHERKERAANGRSERHNPHARTLHDPHARASHNRNAFASQNPEA
ncbi:hypothetical protein GCM10027203_54680 [Nonomuraea fastidiosa]